MPLQKSPPPVTPNLAKPSLTCAQLAERRRTLQTVCELSSLKTTTVDLKLGPLPSGSNFTDGANNNREKAQGTKTPRTHKRRSLPNSGLGRGQGQPLAALKPSDTLVSRRSLAELGDWGEVSTRRHSVDSRLAIVKSSEVLNFTPSLCSQASSTVSQHDQISHRKRQGKSDGSNRSSWNHGRGEAFRGKQAVRVVDATGKPLVYGGWWNAHRERERMSSERGVNEARAGRERERRGIVIGSSSTLPSISPFPMVKPREVHIRAHGNQQTLVPNNRLLHGTHGSVNRMATKTQVDPQRAHGDTRAELLKHASTETYEDLLQPDYQDPIQRSRSSSSATWCDQRPVPQLVKFPPSPAQNRISQDPTLRLSFGSTRPPPNQTTRTSPTHSNVSGNTNLTQVSQKSCPSRSSTGSKCHRHTSGSSSSSSSIIIIRDAVSPLTLPSSSQGDEDGQGLGQNVGFIESQHIGSGSEIRVGRLPAAAPTPRLPSQVRYRSRSRSRSDKGVLNRVPLPYEHALDNVSSRRHDDKEATQQGPNPHMIPKSVRIQREKEKLERWKAERGRREFQRRQRAKISERVRRANELEEEKEKELVREGKGTRKEKGQNKNKGKGKGKAQRGCLGGLFGLVGRTRSSTV